MPSSVVPATAAHSPATAASGLGILAAGGSAADAAVAMTLTACVVEPFVVSLLSGMHAVHVDQHGVVRGVDGFVDVPATVTGGRHVQTAINFGGARVPYTIGGATFGTPGLVGGCWLLHQRFGRLPWDAVVSPAIARARGGFVLTDKDESLLAMLESVMTIGVGQEVYCVGDRLKRAGERIIIPEAADLLEELANRGGLALQEGPLAKELASFCGDVGSLVTAEDLAAHRAREHTPPSVRLDGWSVHARRGLSPLTDWVARLQEMEGPEVVQVARAQSPIPPRALGTTSLAAVDERGQACAVTASLGLGTGDWFRGCQFNSMLGEVDLQDGPLRPRSRMGSMMAPTALIAPDGAATVVGAAGGSRIPSTLLRTVDGMVRQGLDLPTAVDLPRIHRIGDVVHVEPTLAEHAQNDLEAAGFTVQRWTSRHHYFGGVSGAGAAGAAGDPRRGGAAPRLA